MPYYVYKPLRVVFETWTAGKQFKRSIPKSEWYTLGLRPDMTHDEVKEQLRRWNVNDALERRKAATNLRVAKASATASKNFPALLVAEFWGENRRRIREHHWRAAQTAIDAVNLAPADWYERRRLFYEWLAGRRYSPDYCKRILRAVNEWGYFNAWKSRAFYRQIPLPRGEDLVRIRRAYHRKVGDGLASKPLYYQELKARRAQFSAANYNWLLLTVAFGLRPEEVDRRLFEVQDDALRVYQPKLERRALPPSHCWKKIPIKLRFQRDALAIAAAGELVRPSRAAVRAAFGPGYTLYAGRKGFVPYMIRRGYNEYAISKWMGHTDTITTRRHYDRSDVA